MPAKKKQPATKGGKRSNAGRKKVPVETKIISVTFSFHPEEKADLDERRGDIPRGRYVAKKLKLGRKKL
jgi:hypothetical protein